MLNSQQQQPAIEAGPPPYLLGQPYTWKSWLQRETQAHKHLAQKDCAGSMHAMTP